jgi:serine protease Do
VTVDSPDVFTQTVRGTHANRRSFVRARLFASIAIVALAFSAAVYAAQHEPASGAFQASSNTAAFTHATPTATTPSFADLVERVRPAVVAIRARLAVTAVSASDGSTTLGSSPPEKIYRDPSTLPQQRRLVEAQGSGFLVSEDGFVVTNNHVVDGALKLQVVLDDGKVADARVVGKDAATDLALLKVDQGSHLPFVALADTKPRVGEWVLAMGNPFGLGNTVTAGIVSAMDRDIGATPYGGGFIQIDAPVNRGNSGGPTFDTRGQVIGINTAIYSPSGGSVGIAFDVPAATVKRVITQLKDHGRVDRGWLGVTIEPVTRDIADALGLTDAAGALVAGVQAASPAAKAGVLPGDVIAGVNGTVIKNAREVARIVGEVRPGDTVALTIRRNGEFEAVKVRLDSMQG